MCLLKRGRCAGLVEKGGLCLKGKIHPGSGKGGEGDQAPETRGSNAFEVVGIPLKDPGLYVVELESAILGKALLDPPKPCMFQRRSL